MPLTLNLMRLFARCLPIILCSLLISGEPAQERLLGERYFVERVIDGDTIYLGSGESVRYIGVDAPEIHHPSRGMECFGPEAAKRNRELVEGRWVALEEDAVDRDSYGRLLRYVYVDGMMVNAVLVEEGYAYSYYWPPNTKHYQELIQLELKAEQARAGLWDHCR